MVDGKEMQRLGLSIAEQEHKKKWEYFSLFVQRQGDIHNKGPLPIRRKAEPTSPGSPSACWEGPKWQEGHGNETSPDPFSLKSPYGQRGFYCGVELLIYHTHLPSLFQFWQQTVGSPVRTAELTACISY